MNKYKNLIESQRQKQKERKKMTYRESDKQDREKRTRQR